MAGGERKVCFIFFVFKYFNISMFRIWPFE